MYKWGHYRVVCVTFSPARSSAFAERRAKSFSRSWSDPTPIKPDSLHDSRDSESIHTHTHTKTSGTHTIQSNAYTPNTHTRHPMSLGQALCPLSRSYNLSTIRLLFLCPVLVCLCLSGLIYILIIISVSILCLCASCVFRESCVFCLLSSSFVLDVSL